MQGREGDFPEASHRHPSEWWNNRYEWINEQGEPRMPDYRSCGRAVHGLEYMRDEFPEQAPHEQMRLNCLRGQKLVTWPCIDMLDEDDATFPEVAKNLVPSEFLKTQREKFEEARIKAMMKSSSGQGKARAGMRKLDRRVLRKKIQRKLIRKKRNVEMKDFLADLRARSAEGYSERQLIQSHIPDVGTEIKVSAPEVTAAVAKYEVAAILRKKN